MTSTKKKEKQNLHIIPKIIKTIACLLLCFIIFSIIIILSLKWINPPTTAVMITQHIINKDKKHPVKFQWADWEDIAPYMPLAVIAAEDQKFFYHYGFDVQAILKAIEDNNNKSQLKGASTITQQVAKNLFLWKKKSYIRKAFEAYLTTLLELLWSKKRILEVYLNIAEFGNNIYGVSAASNILLGKSANKLTKNNAALLAAALPNPKQFNVKRPSAYMNKRRIWIKKQMRRLGGITILKKL